MNKHSLNEKGFTLFEILVVMMIIAIVSAASILVYSNLTSQAVSSQLSQNITDLQGEVRQYVKMNGYTLNNLSAGSLQNDGLIPSNWSVQSNADWVVPSNPDQVSQYYIGLTPPYGAAQSGGIFTIGFQTASVLTNTQILTICREFLNQISGVAFNGQGYSTASGGGCQSCSCIASGDGAVQDNQFFLAFE